MITATQLTKRFGERLVLRGLDVQVEPGVTTLLVGANGAGKTTLLRIVTGLLRPDSGAVQVAGHDVSTSRIHALASLAFLPQSPRFHPRLTTRQVAEYYGHLRRRASGEIVAELERWGLQEHLRSTTSQLSGGLRQRLALAIFALARAPVLVLDEPGLSLDPEWRRRLQLFLTEAAANGATVLVATHLLGEWEGRVDRCILLEHGRVAGMVPPDRIRERFGCAQEASWP